MTDPKPFLDEDGNPYEPYTAEELAIMWQTHHPQAEDGDSWFTGRWLATVKELQGALEFYADAGNFEVAMFDTIYETTKQGRSDFGTRAKQALEGKPKG